MGVTLENTRSLVEDIGALQGEHPLLFKIYCLLDESLADIYHQSINQCIESYRLIYRTRHMPDNANAGSETNECLRKHRFYCSIWRCVSLLVLSTTAVQSNPRLITIIIVIITCIIIVALLPSMPTGQSLFAFNQIQRIALPPCYRPPHGCHGGNVQS